MSKTASSGGQSQGPVSGKSKSSSTPTLDEIATDLTSKAEKGELDPVVGRAAELERVVQILSRRRKIIQS